MESALNPKLKFVILIVSDNNLLYKISFFETACFILIG